jgi:transposase-like protein
MIKKAKGRGRFGKVSRRTRAYPYEFRLQIVRLYLEEGYNTSVLREQFGVSNHSVQRWVKAYRQQGAEGLVPKLPSRCTAQAHRGRQKTDCGREEVPSGVRASAHRCSA